MQYLNLSFRPRIIDALQGYDRARFFNDLMAGLTVGVVALPLAMAFAIASGAKPEAGIFAAIIGGFLVSALGGSRVQIGGPAGAFIVVIYAIIEKYGLVNLFIATMFAGVLLCAMGMLRLGSVIRYIPVPIVIGFTNGIAVLIALSQLKDFFGLDIARMPGDFFAQLKILAAQAHTANMLAIAIAALALLLLFVWPKVYLTPREDGRPPSLLARCWRILKAIPGPVLVLVLATTAVNLLGLQVETIGSRFGGIPQGLPQLQLPSFSWDLVRQLFSPALTIALLGAVESLLCARVADNLTEDRHDPNQELLAQGIANFIVPFFGALPVTGTMARTTTNIRAGATTPVAGIMHAVTLAAIVLVAAPLAKNIPLAALAAILMHVAFNMGEWREFRRLRHFSNNYRVLVLATFILTVTVDLTVAVEVGLGLACVFFIYRISSLTDIRPIASTPAQPLPEGVAAYALYGSLFFGAAGKLDGLIESQAIPARAMVLEMHKLISLDTTGLDGLETIHKALHRAGSQLILCGINPQPRSLMERTGFIARLGRENCVDDLAAALARLQVTAA
ncbi:SulP family inorganic anion transporter [Janthinobacterium sp. 17J80-10]|uniref:SulP family inorganic anion transporter n=1 Tax=Janthinobacterium sp. 17J80-10 TaxID=2497863 RepID=UPI001005A1FA|nr:SulP family inorganic anion transporter [Janthinobacterium sp. 17J80-10]QAU34196.1 STAS domain-containing protein [Janthinobacterium sp. 17J80-10]